MPTSSRRKELENVPLGSHTHPGLWLEKYLRTSDRKDVNAKRDLVAEVIEASARVRGIYSQYFNRYQATLARHASPVYTARGTTVGRLSVGLGANAVLETSITLHRTYGVPYIPGPALKGLASSYAAKYWQDEVWRRSFDGGKTKRGDLQRLIFGTTDESGLVIFFDALPDPDHWWLDPDVITVHHPDYYQGKDKPPADWDSPTPVPFITARGTFHFFLGLVPLPKSELEAGRKILEITTKLLKQALEEEGVGAKTAIGYGRFKFEGTFEELKPPPPKRSEAYEKLSSTLNDLGWNSPPHEIVRRLEAFSALNEEEKRAFIEEHREKLKRILGSRGAPNTKVLKRAKDSAGLRQLAKWLDLL